MGSLWRVLGCDMIRSDFHFDIIITLAAVLDRLVVDWARAKAGKAVRRLLL